MLEVRNVTKHFGATVAADAVSFTVAQGEIVSLLGPSGCGKTTTLRLIAGFERPDSGEIRIGGRDVTGTRPYERNVGLLFQHYALFPHMTVRDNVAYGLRHRGWPKAEIPDRVSAMLGLVKLQGLDARLPAKLSGGQQQRVALARALATEPAVVLLDEPLSALDAKLRHELRLEIKEILRSVGSTTIIVTHDQEEAMGMAARIIVMEKGRIRQVGSPDDIYWRPGNRFVAGFVGRSNWFVGRAAGAGGGSQTLSTLTTEDGFELRVAAPNGRAGAIYDVGIRPERLEIVSPGAARAADETLIVGTVLDVSPLGAERHIVLRLPAGGQLTVIQPNRAAAAPGTGETVTVRARAADWMVLPREGESSGV